LNEIGEFGTAGYYFECGVDCQEIEVQSEGSSDSSSSSSSTTPRDRTPEQKRERKREKDRVGKSPIYVIYALREVRAQNETAAISLCLNFHELI
jgi:hypothetical protein